MIPLQEIVVHTDKNAFFQVHLVKPTDAAPFSIEVFVDDSELSPPFRSKLPLPPQQFTCATDAFEHALTLVMEYSAKHGYSITLINNPCNCEFLSEQEQQAVVEKAGLSLQVQVNES